MKRPRKWPSGAARESILEDTRALQKALLAEKPSAAGRPTGKVLDPQALTGRAIAKTGPLRGGDTPGFSNLDELLARTGPLSCGNSANPDANRFALRL